MSEPQLQLYFCLLVSSKLKSPLPGAAVDTILELWWLFSRCFMGNIPDFVLVLHTHKIFIFHMVVFQAMIWRLVSGLSPLDSLLLPRQ